MPLTQFIAIVSETKSITPGELQRVAGALDKQVRRDFGDPWEISASVNPYERLEDVPTDYWPIIVRDDIGFEGAAGVHLDNEGQPYALVQASAEWSLTASHEVLEMLADPFGNRLVAGNAPAGAPKKAQGRVNFLVEVCDPSEAAEFAYTVNGVLVSDFYYKSFFDPMKAAGVRYSFTGSLPRPRDIVRGGYISFMVPQSGEWFQKTFFGTKATFRSLGVFNAAEFRSLREFIDGNTPKPLQERKGTARDALRSMAKREITVAPQVESATGGRADRLRTQIAAMIEKKG
jgi:hypothetical protein